MTPTDLKPDVEQAAELQARRLLELTTGYTRIALAFPDEVQALRTVVAELLFEVAILRGRIEALERRAPNDADARGPPRPRAPSNNNQPDLPEGF